MFNKLLLYKIENMSISKISCREQFSYLIMFFASHNFASDNDSIFDYLSFLNFESHLRITFSELFEEESRRALISSLEIFRSVRVNKYSGNSMRAH